MVRRNVLPCLGIVALAVLLLLNAGCARKQQTATTANGEDSLLASSPQETPSGNLKPQNSYQPEPNRENQPTTRNRGYEPRRNRAYEPRREARGPAAAPGRTIPSGTTLAVSVQTSLSSATANVGDTWTGSVERPVVVDGRVLIPEGSTVTGTVSDVRPASHGERAMLDLALSSVNVEGRSYRVHGRTEPIEAGSTRARNLGAIAAGAGAGALIGHAVGHGGKGTLIGGLLGGAAATGAVAASKGYQVVLKPGTRLDFTTSSSVAVRI